MARLQGKELNMRRNTKLRLLPVAILSFVVAEQGSTQTSAADGPWAGWAQCQLTAQGQGYANQQTHTWVLTSTTPTVEGAFRLYPATWTVTGQGSRQRVMGDGRTVVEQWTTAGPPRPAPISVWIRGSDATLRFTSRHAQLRSLGAATGTSTAHSPNGNPPDQTTQIGYDVYEWTFPAIEDVPATSTTVSGSPGPRPVNGSIAPGQPPGTSLTEACSWRFVQSTVLASAPPPAGGSGAQTPAPQTPGSPSTPPTPAPTSPTLTPVLLIPTLTPAPAPSPPPAPTPATGALPTVSPSNPIPSAALPTTGGLTAAPAPAPPPAPQNPAWAKATQVGSDIVITWAPVPGVSRYAVAGASQADWRDIPAGITTVTYSNVPPGSYQWRVGSYYDPGSVATSPTQWTLASISTAVTSGKYRISIAGFQVNSGSQDGLIQGDGIGDEIYAAAIVTQLDRKTGQLKRNELVQSVVHGDGKFPNEELIGSGSPSGGLTTGDLVPAGWHPTSPSPAPRLPGRLPLSLWEGTLQDATDAVVIRSALWEWDGDPSAFNQWRDYALTRAGQVSLSLSRTAATNLSLNVQRDAQSPLWHYCCMGHAGPQLKPGEMSGGFDRLIGLDIYYQDPYYYNYSKYYWADRILVVTREIAEAALTNANSQQLAPGVVAISLIDGPTNDAVYNLRANYTLYLRVERMP